MAGVGLSVRQLLVNITKGQTGRVCTVEIDVSPSLPVTLRLRHPQPGLQAHQVSQARHVQLGDSQLLGGEETVSVQQIQGEGIVPLKGIHEVHPY